MIEALVRFSVRHRSAVVALTLLLALIGAAVSSRLQLDAMPDTTSNQVLVLTRAAGLTPEEVELLVTRPVEVGLGGMPGLIELRSLSRQGLTAVTAVFEDDVDPYRARQLVQERLNAVAGELPEGVEAPELGPLSGGLGEVYQFSLSSPERSGAELLELVQLRVAPLLRQVPGVVEVNTWGGERRTLEVRADPLQLSARGLTLEELRHALEDATGAVPGASLPVGDRQVLLRGVARPESPAALATSLVRQDAQGTVRVGEVANVAFGAEPRTGAATANGQGEVVYVMVQMLREYNALELTANLEARMPAVRQVLPADVEVDVVYDRSKLVKATLWTVAKNLGEGGLLVVFILFLMLGNIRAGLLVASAIPLSMLGATAGMVALGVPGNLMSLGAIDFGLLVDGAVVMVEGLFHHWGLKRGAGVIDRRREVSEVTSSLGRPVFFSVLIIMLVYVPILTMTGVDGKMFRPMALTVVFALATSLLLSLTFIPAAASFIIRPQDVPQRPPRLMTFLERLLSPLMHRALRHRTPVLITSVLLLILGGALFMRAGSEFTPQLDEGDMVIQTTRAPDISIEAAVRDAGQLERALLEEIPEVQQVVSRIGSPAVATDMMGIEQADVFVQLAPRSEWRKGLTRESLIEDMQGVLETRAPGGDPSFTQPIQMRFNELLGGSVTDVAVSIFGEDLGELRELADQTAAIISDQAGAADVRVLAPPDVALLEIHPKPLAAAQAGLTVADVLEAVQAVRTGVPVGSTYLGPLPVPIVLRFDGIEDAFALSSLLLPTGEGGAVRLGQVAELRQVASPGLVSREGGERRLVVGFNVRGGDLGTVVQAASQAVRTGLTLPDGYRVEWGGQYQTLQEAQARLSLVLPGVAVLILALLLLAFRRLRPALVIAAIVPFAAVGGIVTLVLRGMPISISAAVGFIALSGIAVLNGVVLMAREQSLQQEGWSPAEAVRRAAIERMRPVLTTALVAALGFVPMMLATGVGAEVQRPLATVVVGGLLTSTLVTLVILPTLWPLVSGPGMKEVAERAT